MEYLQQLLQKYHSGNASAAEHAQLLSLLEEQDLSLQEALRAAFGDGVDTGVPLLSENRSAAILMQLHEQIGRTAVIPAHKPVVKKLLLRMMVSAAAVVVLLIAGWQWIQLSGRPAVNTIATTQPAAVPLKLLRNGTDKKETILLPDSSVAVLYPNSVLSYAPQFDSRHRNIYLQGEGCFTVAKDAKRPFTVYANGVATTALGTRFSVSTFNAEGSVRVRLMEGKVVVRMQEEAIAMTPVFLLPGQECMVGKTGGEAVVKAFTLSSPTGKKADPHAGTASLANATLEFSREPLANVFKRVEKLYHVTIVYPGVSLAGLSFTGNFLPSDSLPVVLSVICKTNDLAFEQKERLITITSLP